MGLFFNFDLSESWLNAINRLLKPIQESDLKPPPQQNANAERACERDSNQVQPTVPTISSTIESSSIKANEHNATFQTGTRKKFQAEVKIAWQ